MRVTWNRGMKGKFLSVMLVISLLMVLILFLSEQRRASEIEEEDREYRSEHSLFEDIVVGGRLLQGTSAFADSLYESENLTSEGRGLSSETENPAQSENDPRDDYLQKAEAADETGNLSEAVDFAGAGEDSSGEQAAEVPRARQETFLRRIKDGKWEIDAPGDLADGGHIYFNHFRTLKLSPSGEESAGSDKESGRESSGVFLLHSGDILPQDCLESGSLWQAQALGRKDEVLEEAELVIYCARDVATLYVNTESGSLEALDTDQSVREQCRYLVCRADGSRDVSGRCEIHGRGNSSWKEDKKQYSLNLASERSILGMDNARKFALIANTSDPSFLRNKTTYDLAVLTGMPSSPQCAFVNVYFNGEYHGLYLMAQRPNAKDGSVHIAELEKKNLQAAGLDPDAPQTGEELSDIEGSAPQTGTESSEPEGDGSQPETDPSGAQNPEETVETVTLVNEDGLEIHASPQEEIPENISGGYLLEIDARYEEENYWFSTKTHHFVVKYPEAVPLRECEYIAGYLREAETALYSDDGVNHDTGKSWEDYFDIQSWASMYLMQDFMTQWDVESFSFFLYKDADDPHLYCGPVWDFDLSMGATGLGKLPDVMRLSIWLREHRQGWLTELEKFPAFTEALESFAGKRFFPLLTEYVSEDTKLSIPGFRDYMKTLGSSVKMDAHRWGEPDHFEEESEKLLSWIKKRADFWQEYAEDPAAFCKVTLQYGFRDMDIYIPRGQAIGFVPTEEYGEYFYSSFREKYGSIDGWHCEDGSLLTPETVIDRDQVMTPFSNSE